jgi:hypothetical protein
MRMRDLRDCLGFALQALPQIRIRRELEAALASYILCSFGRAFCEEKCEEVEELSFCSS